MTRLFFDLSTTTIHCCGHDQLRVAAAGSGERAVASLRMLDGDACALVEFSGYDGGTIAVCGGPEFFRVMFQRGTERRMLADREPANGDVGMLNARQAVTVPGGNVVSRDQVEALLRAVTAHLDIDAMFSWDTPGGQAMAAAPRPELAFL